MTRKRIIIIGAAGRDFHNFNVYYRDREEYEVLAFTAAQIPNIDKRRYPAQLAGELYPDGIGIYPEKDLEKLIKDLKVDECVFAYSDVEYRDVMATSALVNSAGADFKLLGPKNTMLKSKKPVISVCATRTGTGKSQTSRKIIETLMAKGIKPLVVRHPMPYGDLYAQRVQRFARLEDLEKHKCTIEEMEEYEPHLDRGNIVYAGVDYEAILREAENDPDGCDLIVWDGGNNDFSFFKPDLAITVLDPHRLGDELNYYPGEVSLRTAHIAIINKVDSGREEDIKKLEENIRMVNPEAIIIKAESEITVDNIEAVKDRSVLIVEDGPTLTHGGMDIGAGTIAAERFGASQIIDPRPFALGELKETLDQYERIGDLLPAMGYSENQLKDLEKTIANIKCDTVLIGTPIDLGRIIKIDQAKARVSYQLKEVDGPSLEDILEDFIKEHRI